MAVAKPSAKAPAFPKSAAGKADALIVLRDKKKAAQEVVDDYDAQMKALEAALLEQLDAEGTTQVRGKMASASVSESTVFNITDDTAFFEFVRKNKYFHLLQRRLSNPAVREIFETKGVVPGCTPFPKRTINLRSAA